MDTLKNKICRICLDEGTFFDWNNAMEDYPDTTYKDCYYKYTQINCQDADDHFSSMLCFSCMDGLRSMHALLSRALDSYNFFMEITCNDSKVFEPVISEEENYSSTPFEAMYIEKTDSETEMQVHYECEYSNDKSYEVSIEIVNSVNKKEMCKNELENCDKSPDANRPADMYSSNTKEPVPTNGFVKQNVDDYEYINRKKLKLDRKSNRPKPQVNDLENISEIENLDDTGKKKRQGRHKKKVREDKIPRMCSICSRVLANKYALEKHEKTHIENRERKATCPICGLKFFERANLVTHMHIHNEKRERKHKCEFCDKDFFEKGTLNIHRRIHLGQMIPCTLCSKEFYRQVDLDIHLNSHAEAPISSKAKKRKIYFSRCTECDKEIRTTNYRAHMAAHFNEPLMKCLICDKGFYIRDSCVFHVREVHKKSKEEYKDYIEVYDKSRLSHLLLAQTTGVKSFC